jgi:hypothetical protein
MESSKFQAPSSKEVPNPKLQQLVSKLDLEIGAWDLFGAWNLEFGA